MLFRFSLYGFLKNQKYYEPFLIFAFLEKGLSFFEIGLLIGFRELCINLFEIPSGAVADLYGKRRAMIFSFVSYIFSFVVFALSIHVSVLFGAMFFFAIGEAFRTGTHKAMIFTWLERENRINEKTKVYGFTRSWSQTGSALSVVIAALIVIFSGNYSQIFWYSIVPYIFGVINFLGYPAFLDGERKHAVSLKKISTHLLDTVRDIWKNRALGRTLVESMTQDGTYSTVKDYLQPILKHAALAMPLFLYLDDQKRAAILVGAVYFVLHMVSSYASRSAHRVCTALGGEHPARQKIWIFEFFLFLLMIPLFFLNLTSLLIAAFIVLALIQNVWRPIVLALIDTTSDAEKGATILSVESQAKSLFVMLAAPLLGHTVDLIRAPNLQFLPIAVFGLLMVGLMLLTSRRKPVGSVQTIE